MPTRFYLPSAGAPDVSPAWGGAWTGSLVDGTQPRFPLVTTKSDTALATASHAEAVTSNPAKNPLAQFVSAPLAAQTIGGNVSGVILARESSTSANASLALVVRVVSSDGLTERAVLYAPAAGFINSTTVADAWGSEFATTASTRTVPVTALTPYTCVDGDRLVVELGSRNENSVATNYTATLTIGDPAATADYARTPGLTTSLDPWIEFDSTIAFSSGAGVTGTLSAALPGIVANASGTSINPASVAASVALMAAALAGLATDPAVLTTALPTPAAAVSGAGTNPAGLGAAVTVPTAAIVGTATNPASLAANQPRTTSALSDQTMIAGTLAAGLPPTAATFAGTSLNPAAMTSVAPLVVVAAGGQSTNPASITAAAPMLSADTGGTTTNPGTLVGPLPVVAASLGDAKPPPDHATVTLNAPVGRLSVTAPVASATLTAPVATATITTTRGEAALT